MPDPVSSRLMARSDGRRDRPAPAAAGLVPRSAPSAEGMDARSVMAVGGAFEGRAVECHSVVVLRHGRIVADGWGAPDSPARLPLLYSVTKSFTAIAVGFAVADGVLKLDDRVVDVLSDHVLADASEQAKELTVHHLLTMTTGHRTDTLAAAWELEPMDLVKGFLRVP